MRLPTRPITPDGVLNSLRINLLDLHQPHSIGFLSREAFVLAWGQFAEWRETPSGHSRIETARAIAEEERNRQVSVPATMPSSDLVKRELRLRSVEGGVLNVRDLAPEIHAEIATFAFWKTGRDPEREWRTYSSYPAVLRALRREYERRLARTPIGERVLGIFWGDPARTEEYLDDIVTILVRKLGGRVACVHPDRTIRAEETRQIVRYYVIAQLTDLQPASWQYWVPDLLDGRVISPCVAAGRVTDAFRKSKREDRWKFEPQPDEGDQREEGEDPSPVPAVPAFLNGPARAWLDAEAGVGCAAIVNAYLDPRKEGALSQRAVAETVGVSPRTVFDRLAAMRGNAKVLAFLRDHLLD